MNVLDYIKSQIEVWGEEYVYDLMDKNFMPILTDRGWRWLHVSQVKLAERSYVT